MDDCRSNCTSASNSDIHVRSSFLAVSELSIIQQLPASLECSYIVTMVYIPHTSSLSDVGSSFHSASVELASKCNFIVKHPCEHVLSRASQFCVLSASRHARQASRDEIVQTSLLSFIRGQRSPCNHSQEEGEGLEIEATHTHTHAHPATWPRYYVGKNQLCIHTENHSHFMEILWKINRK